MKIAISLDDELSKEADDAARVLGLSRSGLFALALSEFLQRRRDEEITRRLNEAYADGSTSEEKRILKGMKAKFRRTIKDPW